MACEFKLYHKICGGINAYRSEYCADHKDVRCHICDAQATHECIESESCRAPLCNGHYCYVTHNEMYNHTVPSQWGPK